MKIYLPSHPVDRFTQFLWLYLCFFSKGYWGVTRYSLARTRQVDWVSGACLLGKNLRLKGTFDEKIYVYGMNFYIERRRWDLPYFIIRTRSLFIQVQKQC
jgi:hypothetical protein